MRMAVLALSAALAALALAGCDMSHQAPAPPKEAVVEAPVEAPPAEPVLTATTPMTGAQMVDCAGALAASGNVEIAAGGPTQDNAATNAVWGILALLDKEEAYKTDAAKARADVVAARDAWKSKTPAELTAKSANCAIRFPG